MKLLSIIIAFLLLPVFCVFAQQGDKSQLFSNKGNEVTPLTKVKTMPIAFSEKGIINLYLAGFFTDSVSAVGNPLFKITGGRIFFYGQNYRQEWKTSIRVPVLDLGTEKGGLTPLKRGGGKQTKSLRLEDKNGRQYTLRSIQKYVTDEALPPELRGTFAKDLVADGVSASYPYAALSVTRLSEAAGIPHGNPKIVYIPDDPRLGEYQKEFANSLSLLEERLPDSVDKAYDTEEVADKLKDDNDNDVDQLGLLKTRLVDMYIMDLDRHELQWTWGAYDNGKGKTFYAVAKDRDQAFYISQGLLPSLARRPWLAPQVQGFRAKAMNINRFNYAARNLDRFFLNELGEEDWKKATDEFLAKMTDGVIEQALNDQPVEIRKMSSAADITRKLKDRRAYFAGESMHYYRFISKYVDITGSDKKELFDVTRNEDGSVLLQVYKINKEGEQSRKMYKRKFDPAVTKEIRLYGFGGDDKFLIHGDKSDIKIRMIGGDGEDNFENSSSSPSGKNIVYDLKSENNKSTGALRSKISNDTAVNSYKRIYYKYNQTIPSETVSYNLDDGLFLGFSLKLIRHGFRKDPYKMLHQFSVNHALATGAYNFRYYSEYIGVFGQHSDLLFDADIKEPSTTTNFFGYNNGFIYDKKKPGKFRYYRARYGLGDISLSLRKNFSSFVKMTIGPTFEFYSMDSSDNRNRFIIDLANPDNGLDPLTLFAKQSYFGGNLTLEIDTRKNKALSMQGVKWLTSLKVLSGLNDASRNLTQLKSDFSFYLPLSKSFILAARFGAGHNFGDFEFYQAQYLGGTENLRGYRKYRFAGQTMAYNNLEMRIKLSDFKTYLFPGALGLLFFHDIGRVWVDNNTSTGWKSGYGGGFWIAPLKRFVITASYTASKEDKLPLITLGWQF